MTFRFAYRWLILGDIAIELTTLAGLWASLGVHLSIWPLYIDIHFLWWILSIMSKERSIEIRGYEEAYEEG